MDVELEEGEEGDPTDDDSVIHDSVEEEDELDVVEESTKQLKKDVEMTNLIKEDLDQFKKLINHRN